MQKLTITLSLILIGLITGYIIQRLVLSEKIKADKSLTKQRLVLQDFALLILNPVAAMGAMWILSFHNIRIAFMPIIGALAIGTGGVSALILSKLLKMKQRQAGAFFISGAICNLGAIGGLIVFIFLGEEAYALVPIYQIFESIIYFTIWFPLAKSFSPHLEANMKSKRFLKIITDPFVLVTLLSIIIGLSLNFLNIPRPSWYSKLNALIIPLMSLLLLMSIGMAMKFGKIKAYLKPALIIASLKFLFVPFIATGLAYLLGFGSIDNGLPLKVILILSSMPVGFIALVPPSIYDLDIDLANAAWLLTTGMLVVIIPLQMLIISFM